MEKSTVAVKREPIEGMTRTNEAGQTLQVMKVSKGGRGRPGMEVALAKGQYVSLRDFDKAMKPKGKRGRPSKAAAGDAVAANASESAVTENAESTAEPAVASVE